MLANFKKWTFAQFKRTFTWWYKLPPPSAVLMYNNEHRPFSFVTDGKSDYSMQLSFSDFHGLGGTDGLRDCKGLEGLWRVVKGWETKGQTDRNTEGLRDSGTDRLMDWRTDATVLQLFPWPRKDCGTVGTWGTGRTVTVTDWGTQDWRSDWVKDWEGLEGLKDWRIKGLKG